MRQVVRMIKIYSHDIIDINHKLITIFKTTHKGKVFHTTSHRTEAAFFSYWSTAP